MTLTSPLSFLPMRILFVIAAFYDTSVSVSLYHLMPRHAR